jgi:hypothetical protein
MMCDTCSTSRVERTNVVVDTSTMLMEKMATPL